MYTDAYISIKSFFDKIGRDRIYTFSATSAFFLILSLFPFLILLLTVIQYTPLTQEFLIEKINFMLPEALAPFLTEIINEIYQTTSRATLIFFAAIGAIWSSSKGMLAMLRGINVCFNMNDKRNYFHIRLISCLYIVIIFVMLLFLLITLVFGSTIYQGIKGYLGDFNAVIEFILNQRFPIAVFILTVFFMALYKFCPARHNKFFRMFPGALIAAIGWVVISWAVSLYVKYFPNFSYTYGSLASFILLMMWLYFGMYIIFVCAEINFFMNIWFDKQARKRLKNKAAKYEKKMETKQLRIDQVKRAIRHTERNAAAEENEKIYRPFEEEEDEDLSELNNIHNED